MCENVRTIFIFLLFCNVFGQKYTQMKKLLYCNFRDDPNADQVDLCTLDVSPLNAAKVVQM